MAVLDGTRFVKPIPSGTEGRADEGVDISARPGAPIVDPVPGISQLFKVIPNWFRGQAYEAFRIISGPFKGRAWYGAEQIDFSTRQLGQQFSQGQQIGTYAAEGTATEFGWADPASGEAVARGHYTEGVPTPEGLDFAARVRGATGAPITRPGGDGGPGGGSVEEVFSAYQAEINMDRTKPSNGFVSTSEAGLRAPFQWWLQSFIGKWQADIAGASPGSAGGAAAASSSGGGWSPAHLTWYGPVGSGFADPTGGGTTYANGEKFRPGDMVAANDKLPFGTVVDIRWHGKMVTVTVKDRFGSGQPVEHFDLTPAPALALGMMAAGSVTDAQYRTH